MENKTPVVDRYKKLALIYVQRLTDVSVLGQVIFAIIVLLVTLSGIKTIQTNYGLQKQITKLNQQNDVAQLQNTNMKLQNEYYKSDQYTELSARQNFGLAQPGEKMLIVPKNVALSYTTDIPNDYIAPQTPPQPQWQRNLDAWVDFFLHRGQTED